jgi:hypothetical protein
VPQSGPQSLLGSNDLINLLGQSISTTASLLQTTSLVAQDLMSLMAGPVARREAAAAAKAAAAAQAAVRSTAGKSGTKQAVQPVAVQSVPPPAVHKRVPFNVPQPDAPAAGQSSLGNGWTYVRGRRLLQQTAGNASSNNGAGSTEGTAVTDPSTTTAEALGPGAQAALDVAGDLLATGFETFSALK